MDICLINTSSCTEIAKKIAFAPLRLVQKIVELAYRLFNAVIGLFVTRAAVKHFVKTFSYEAMFTTNFVTHEDGTTVDQVFRVYRTDLEPDDVTNFITTAIEMQRQFQKTGQIPSLNVVVSEGSVEILDLKISTLQNILCRLAAEGKIDERILAGFRFYEGAGREVGATKIEGYRGIHTASERLMNEEARTILERSFAVPQGGYQRESVMHEAVQHLTTQLRGANLDPKIFEMCIAPADGLLEFYEQHLDLAKHTTVCGYGAYNYVKTMERMPGNATHESLRLGNLLNTFSAVYTYEAYLGTDPEFNKVGLKTTPEVFAPLSNSERRSDLQTFIFEAFQAWNVPSERKFRSYFTTQFGENGQRFLEALDAQVQAHGVAFTKEQAFELYPQFFQCVDGDRDRSHKKITDKLKILHNLLVNGGVQGTVSDFGLAQTLAHPTDVLNPVCLSENGKVTFVKEPKGQRMNTVFERGEGPAFVVQNVKSDWLGDHSAINIPKLKRCMADFFAFLGTSSTATAPALAPARVEQVPLTA